MNDELSPRAKLASILCIAAFVLSNARATVFWRVYTYLLQSNMFFWVELSIWVFLLFAMCVLLIKDDLLDQFTSYWIQNWLLSIFIIVALLSIAWSIAPVVTVYRSLSLFFSSLIGCYIGLRFSDRNFIYFLYYFGAFVIAACFLVVATIPTAGIMFNEPYSGAWRGIFWHKNHLGNLMPLFSMTYILCIFENMQTMKWRELLLSISLYCLSVVLVIASRSAGGLILTIVLSVFVLLAYLWTKYHVLLKSTHYYLVLAAVLVMTFLTLLNLNSVFGLFNRNTTLTGRVPLWRFLISKVILLNPWVGYGFGAIWSIESFRIGAQKLLGWSYPIVIADNGLLDILLHLGLIGFVPFAFYLIVAFVKTIRFAISQRTIFSFFPMLVLLYALLANLSFSLFLETDTFVWLMIITVFSFVNRQLKINESQLVTS